MEPIKYKKRTMDKKHLAVNNNEDVHEYEIPVPNVVMVRLSGINQEKPQKQRL